MKEKNAGPVLTFAYFFLVSGIISLFSVIVTLLVTAFMGFSPLRDNSFSQIVIMSYIPFGWTIISFAAFGFLFYCAKYNKGNSSIHHSGQ